MSELDSVSRRIAERVAAKVERRKFLRRSAQSVFVVLAGVAAGEGWQVFKSASAYACDCNDSSCTNGKGCPTGGEFGLHPCGPSPCCSSLSSSCDCGSGGACKSGGNCQGHGYSIYSSGCWSCPVVMNGYVYITTCCDCTVKAACNTPYGRCISWSIATNA
jgi:hypothetical protein